MGRSVFLHQTPKAVRLIHSEHDISSHKRLVRHEQTHFLFDGNKLHDVVVAESLHNIDLTLVW